MYSLTVVIGAAIAGGITVGGVVWLVMIIGQLRNRVAELEKTKTATVPAWAENFKLDQRAQLASIATLSELALSDLLDAVIRLSPEAARRAVEKHVPQLFIKEVK